MKILHFTCTSVQKYTVTECELFFPQSLLGEGSGKTGLRMHVNEIEVKSGMATYKEKIMSKKEKQMDSQEAKDQVEEATIDVEKKKTKAGKKNSKKKDAPKAAKEAGGKKEKSKADKKSTKKAKAPKKAAETAKVKMETEPGAEVSAPA